MIIVPVGISAKTTSEDRENLYNQAEALATVLEAASVRVQTDKREGYTPGWKFNEWEQKGVPLRLEFGPGESAGHYVTTSRRDLPPKESKGTIQIPDLATAIPALLEQIQADMYDRADEAFRTHRVQITNWDDFVPALDNKNVG